jgi:hypothetical protein
MVSSVYTNAGQRLREHYADMVSKETLWMGDHGLETTIPVVEGVAQDLVLG